MTAASVVGKVISTGLVVASGFIAESCTLCCCCGTLFEESPHRGDNNEVVDCGMKASVVLLVDAATSMTHKIDNDSGAIILPSVCSSWPWRRR